MGVRLRMCQHGPKCLELRDAVRYIRQYQQLLPRGHADLKNEW